MKICHEDIYIPCILQCESSSGSVDKNIWQESKSESWLDLIIYSAPTNPFNMHVVWCGLVTHIGCVLYTVSKGHSSSDVDRFGGTIKMSLQANLVRKWNKGYKVQTCWKSNFDTVMVKYILTIIIDLALFSGLAQSSLGVQNSVNQAGAILSGKLTRCRSRPKCRSRTWCWCWCWRWAWAWTSKWSGKMKILTTLCDYWFTWWYNRAITVL